MFIGWFYTIGEFRQMLPLRPRNVGLSTYRWRNRGQSIVEVSISDQDPLVVYRVLDIRSCWN